MQKHCLLSFFKLLGEVMKLVVWVFSFLNTLRENKCPCISSSVVAQQLTADRAAATSTVEVVWDISLRKKIV